MLYYTTQKYHPTNLQKGIFCRMMKSKRRKTVKNLFPTSSYKPTNKVNFTYILIITHNYLIYKDIYKIIGLKII